MMLGENEVACLPTLESVERLIPKYDQPLPRYTSYPTTPVWSEKFGPVEYREALRQSRSLDLSLYVHIPFCESLCTYCACNREVRRDHSVVEPYLDALEREADALAEALGSARRGVQLALGGGTPTYSARIGCAVPVRSSTVASHRPRKQREASKSILGSRREGTSRRSPHGRCDCDDGEAAEPV